MTRLVKLWGGGGAIRIALASLALLAANVGYAGGRLPCEEARVFSDAAVNALILPYRDETQEFHDPESISSRLSVLIQRETLFSMLKYGSVGSTELISHDGSLCDVRSVIDRISGDDHDGSLKEGHAVAILWGRIFEEDDQIFVQSYLRFFRKGVDEGIEVDRQWDGEQRLRLRGSLPASAVAMMPRRLTQSDVEAIEARAENSLLLYEDSDESSDSKPFSDSPYEPLTFGVTDADGDWMQVVSYVTGESGWVRARADSEDWALRRFLPELAYFEGIVGYLRIRTADVQGLTTSPSMIVQWMNNAFSEYSQAVGNDATPDAGGVALAATGMAQYLQAESQDDRALAATQFQDAAKLMPGSSGARELAAIAGPMPDEEWLPELEHKLLGALAISPDDVSVLQNLEQIYELMEKDAIPDTEHSRYAQKRLALVQSAIQAMESGSP